MASNNRLRGPLEVAAVYRISKNGWREVLISLRIENQEVLELTADELSVACEDAQVLIATFNKRG